jgi:DNA gyrase subunit A
MSIAGVSEQGRATQGVKLIRLDETDEIAAITKLDRLEEESNVAIIDPAEAVIDPTDAITDTAEEGTGPTTAPDVTATDEPSKPAPENDENNPVD